MTGPWGQGFDEPYTGPPPTRRPEPWQWPSGYWPGGYQPAPWPPQPWGPPPTVPAPPAVTWAPPPGTPPHDVPQSFLRAMRSRDWAWWRPVLGLLLLAVVFVVASTVTVIVALLTGVAPDLQF